jgi:hypothetical protein
MSIKTDLEAWVAGLHGNEIGGVTELGQVVDNQYTDKFNLIKVAVGMDETNGVWSIDYNNALVTEAVKVALENTRSELESRLDLTDIEVTAIKARLDIVEEGEW